MKVGSATGNNQLTWSDRRVKGVDDKAKQGKDKQGQDLLKRLIRQTATIAVNEQGIQATVQSNTETDDTPDIPTFGDVTLTKEEKQLLILGPDFMVTDRLSLQELEIEIQISLTKARWARMNNDEDDNEKSFNTEQRADDVEDDDENLKLDELNEAVNDEMKSTRDVINDNGTSVNFGRVRATDMTNNQRVYVPKTEETKQEALNETRAECWRKAQQKFMNEKCDKTGRQLLNNLTNEQEIGLKTLQKKLLKEN